MRSYITSLYSVPKFVRTVSVTPPSTVSPSLVKVPLFGKRRREERRKNDSESRLSLVANVSEEDAKVFCQSTCGFFVRPTYMKNWKIFYGELKKIELQWSLVPSCNNEIHLKVFDRTEEPNELHTFVQKNLAKSTVIADLFEACGAIINGSRKEENVFFSTGETLEALRLVPSEKEALFSPGALDISNFIVPQSLCTSVSLDVSHVNISKSIATPLFKDLSFQAFCFAFLNSIPLFLKRNDVGIRNIDFVSAEQMRHFRFAWCYLRREGWMTPLELGEFDLLLPPK